MNRETKDQLTQPDFIGEDGGHYKTSEALAEANRAYAERMFRDCNPREDEGIILIPKLNYITENYKEPSND